VTGFLPFCRKELLEQIRTFRLLVLAAAFALVGLGSPLLAKATPDLVSRFAQDDMGGMELVIVREPGVREALFQYHKNFAMLPLLVILLNVGAVALEKSRRIAPMTLVKPVSRSAYLLAKAAVPALLTLGGTLLSACGCLLYTTVLFGEVDAAGFAVANALLLLVLFFYVALALFGSVVAPGVASAAGVGIGGFALISLAGAFPGLGDYTPAGVLSGVADLILGRAAPHLAAGALVTGLATVALLVVAERVLSRQEL
jgi:ABC-2 type transport system permease protein